MTRVTVQIPAISGITPDGQEDFQQFLEKVFPNLPPNTQSSYRSRLSAYLAFCKEHRSSVPPFTADHRVMRDNIEGFLDWLIVGGRKKSTAAAYLSVINVMLDAMKIPSPMQSLTFKKLIRLKLERSYAGETVNQANPIEVGMLKRLNALGFRDDLDVRNTALVNIAFDTLCRASELAELRWDDLRDKSILVRRSKTDQGGHGRYAYVSETSLGLLERLRNITPEHAVFIFNPLRNAHSVYVKEKHGSQSPLSYQAIVKGMRSALVRCGFNYDDFSAHSGRVGAALEMRKAGLTPLEIAQAGGWKTAEMVAWYTRHIELEHSGASKFAEIAGR